METRTSKIRKIKWPKTGQSEREVVGLNAVFHTKNKNKMPPPHVLRVVRHECRNPATTRVACDKCRNLMMNEKAACLVDMIRI